MRALSDDLRERVWRACQDGTRGPSEAADDFGVSRSFVFKLLRRYRDEGSLTAKARGGNRPPALSRSDLSALRRLVRTQPDATLAELCQSLDEQRGVKVQPWTVCRALARLKLPLKKKRFTIPGDIRFAFAACVERTLAS